MKTLLTPCTRVYGLLLLSAIISSCGVVKLDPLTDEELQTTIAGDEKILNALASQIDKPLTLEYAMALALQHNLDNRVKLMEHALTRKNFKLARMDMLPLLAANAGYLDRDNLDASRSVSVENLNDETLRFSTSVEQQRYNSDVRLSWNVLDFGISYLKAKQEADRVMIAKETRKSVMLKLLQQIRTAYWKAAVTQQLKQAIDQLTQDTEVALSKLENINRRKLRAPMETLQQQRTLLTILNKLKGLQYSVQSAFIDLAMLINHPPSDKLVLDIPKDFPALAPIPQKYLPSMERLALNTSGDYINEVYNARIAQREAKKSLLQMIPNLEVFYSFNQDSNKFLFNDTWAQAGIRVSWNILRLFSLGLVKQQNQARQDWIDAKRLAAHMATITRINLGWQEYENALKQFALAERFDDLDCTIAERSEQSRARRAMAATDSFVDKAKAMSSSLSKNLSYADAQAVYGNLILNLGFNPIPKNFQTLTPQALADHLKTAFANWTDMVDDFQAETSNNWEADTSQAHDAISKTTFEPLCGKAKLAGKPHKHSIKAKPPLKPEQPALQPVSYQQALPFAVTIIVKSGQQLKRLAHDWLHSIGHIKHTGLVEPMVDWILEHNPNAFANGQARSLKAGAKLQFPTQDEFLILKNQAWPNHPHSI